MGSNRGSQSTTLLIGIQAIANALQSSPQCVLKLFAARESSSTRVREVLQLAYQQGIVVETVSRESLDRQSDGQRHQDLIADFRPINLYGESDLDGLLDAAGASPLVLVLDGVQDPHNLGACLRSASASGAAFAVLTQNRSSGLTPVARRAASGAAESLPLLFATNLARVLRQLKTRGVWLAGTSEHAEQELYSCDLNGPLALVMGGEGTGLRRLTAELCDYLVKIPMPGPVSSLNVSVATGICLFEAVRQRNAV